MTKGLITRRAADERGAFMALWPALLMVLLAIAALLVDLGQVRASRRAAQSVADLAVLAGSKRLGAGDPAGACRDTITYFNANAPGLTTKLNATSFCNQGGNEVALTSCSGGSLTQARPSAVTGRYTVSLHYPVPASEIADARFSGAGLNDGTPCERMALSVTAADPSYFAGLLGKKNLQTTRTAVARAAASTSLRTPSLWLLDPTGCTSLKASGGTQLNVGTNAAPGLITIDSSGSACSSNQDTVSSSGNSTQVNALPVTGGTPGEISLFALPLTATTCADPACNASDVAAGRIRPQPLPAGSRATRAPVDWRFNCKASYPSYHGISIEGCKNAGTTPAYIDLLRSAIGTSGQPAGYQQWTSTYSCNPAGTLVAAGNWWIDCPTLSLGTGTTITFTGGNIVTDGSISNTGAVLNINTANPMLALPASCVPPLVVTPCLAYSSQNASFVYMRSGNLTTSGNAFTLNHVALIQQSGYLKNSGGAAPLWSAPTEGPFSALSLWSELASGQYQINGGAAMALTGVFFTPEAQPFSISGGSPVAQQLAQFISFQLAATGGGLLSMAPDPNNFITLPPRAGVLIR